MYRDFFDSFRQGQKIICLKMEVFTLPDRYPTFIIVEKTLKHHTNIVLSHQ
jgi:hypothetical protein